MKLAAALLFPALALSADAQSATDRSLDSLGDEAARSVVRYTDRRAAAADGYHRIGPDFPGMGEHWIHPATLLTGRVSAHQPTILIYANVAGTPTLLGLGFVATTDAAHPTRDLPGWPAAWHEHSGLLSDESGVAPGSPTEGDTHVWVLHVWTTLPNAEGRFLPDNWALPFLRAGLAAPSGTNANAARGVALASGGDRYVRDVLTDARVRTPANAPSIDAAIANARRDIERIVGLVPPGRSPSAPSLDALARQWSGLLSALATVTGEDVARYLAPTHARMGAHGHGTQ